MQEKLRKVFHIFTLGLFLLNFPLQGSSTSCDEMWGNHPLKSLTGNTNQVLFKENFNSLSAITTEYEIKLKSAPLFELNEGFYCDPGFTTLVNNTLPSCIKGSDKPWDGWLINHIHSNGLYHNHKCNMSPPQTLPFGGSEVHIIKEQASNSTLGAIKKFRTYQDGVKELANSLLVSKLMVPLKCELNIAEVLLARRLENKELYILLEGAPGVDINTTLIRHYDDRCPFVLNAVAQYLATFHNKFKVTDNVPYDAKSAYILEHIQALQDLVIEDQDCCKRFLKVFNSIEKEHIINWQGFQDYVLNLCEQYQSDNLNPEALTYTITHGDAHPGNFFYVERNNNNLNKGYHNITMIDYETIIKTYGRHGDPAEDVGRFLGGLWQWAARKYPFREDKIKTYNVIKVWEKMFMDIYLSSIKLNQLQEMLIRKNANFYKLEFYKAILGNKKDTDEELKVKQRLFQFWMTQKSDEEKDKILTSTSVNMEE